MRIAVMGAGAVGGTIAALLNRAGHDVDITARGAHLEAIREGGIRLTGMWGDHTAHVGASMRLGRPPELAFVATKAHDAPGALQSAAALLEGVPVVIVQNGLVPLGAHARQLPRSPVVGALALFAASYLSPGEIEVTAPGSIVIGGDHQLAVLMVERVLSALMPVSVTPDFAGAQWTKLVINQVNALPAITGLSVQATIADDSLRRILLTAMREAVRAGVASGVRFQSLQGLSDRMLRLFLSAPAPLAQLLPLVMSRRMGRVPNPGSTLQSIRRGRLTEVDYLGGEVVARAREADTAAPVSAALVRLVHEVEAHGRFVAPRQVVELVAASVAESGVRDH